MRWAIFPQADRIMRIDEYGRNLHERSQSHGWLHVVRKIEEGASERTKLRDRHAIQRRCHPVFADTEMQIASAIAPSLEVASTFELQPRSVGGRKIRRAADQPGYILRENVENLAGAIACGSAFRICRKGRQIFVPAIWKFAMLHFVDLVCEFGKLLRVGVEHFFPIVAKLAAAFP